MWLQPPSRKQNRRLRGRNQGVRKQTTRRSSRYDGPRSRNRKKTPQGRDALVDDARDHPRCPLHDVVNPPENGRQHIRQSLLRTNPRQVPIGLHRTRPRLFRRRRSLPCRSFLPFCYPSYSVQRVNPTRLAVHPDGRLRLLLHVFPHEEPQTRVDRRDLLDLSDPSRYLLGLFPSENLIRRKPYPSAPSNRHAFFLFQGTSGRKKPSKNHRWNLQKSIAPTRGLVYPYFLL